MINLYNQQQGEGEVRLSQFKTLYKQIGCGKRKALFTALKYDFEKELSDEEKGKTEEVFSVEKVIKLAKVAGENYFHPGLTKAQDGEIRTVFAFTNWLKNVEHWEGFYWSKSAVNTISGKYFLNWHAVLDAVRDKKSVASFKADREEKVKINDAVDLSVLFAVLDDLYSGEDWERLCFKESVFAEKKFVQGNSPSSTLVRMLCMDIEQNAKEFSKKLEDVISLLTEYKSEGSKKHIKEWMEHALAVIRMLKYFRVKPNKVKGKTAVDPCLTKALENLLDNHDKYDWFRWFDDLRNYLTKKPQDNAKDNKLKLNFDNSLLAAGWDTNKEKSNACVILQDNQGRRYLAIMRKDCNYVFEKAWSKGKGKKKQVIKNPLYNCEDGESWVKMDYDFWSYVSKMIPKCSTQLKAVINHFRNSDEDFIFPVGYKVTSGEVFAEEFRITHDQFKLNNEVYRLDNDKIVSAMRFDLPKSSEKIYVKGFQKGYWELLVKSRYPEISKSQISGKWIQFIEEGPKSDEDRKYRQKLSEWIDFCKYFLSKYPKTKLFQYQFRDTNDYTSVDKFNLDVDISSYKLQLETKVDKTLLDNYVKKGEVYLFEIKNQDFNQGKKLDHKNNLHTIYWNAIFNPLQNRPKLNGKAEIFFRKALRDKELTKKVHKDKEIIENFRFSKPMILFHIPITLNFGLYEEDINSKVFHNFSGNENVYFLGLDRGEKHLVYFCIVDGEGKIVPHGQGSLNLPFLGRDGQPRSIKKEKAFYNKQKQEWEKRVVDCWDYNDLLDAAASNRDEARKNWQTIGNIKNLKDGYVSQVIHEIAKIVQDRPTYIVLEDLNTGFKRGRQKIERQVYQKFELALAKKLNFIVNKDAEYGDVGAVNRALQLTPPVQNYQDIENRKQLGIMLYTRANYTSQTDPLTGWRKTIYLKPGPVETSYTKDRKIKNQSVRDQIAQQFDDIGFEGGHYYFEYVRGECVDSKTGEIQQKKWRLWSGHGGISLLRYRGKRGSKNEWNIEAINVEEMLDVLFEEFHRQDGSYMDGLMSGEKQLHKIDEKHNPWDSLRFVIDLIQQIRNSGDPSHEQDENFLVSPVRDKDGKHFDSRDYEMAPEASLPKDADANGAYNIARKGIIMNAHIQSWIQRGNPKKDKSSSDLDLFVSDDEWDMWLNNREGWQEKLSLFSSRKAMQEMRRASKM